MAADAERGPKRMRLRYAGTCRTCQTPLAAGQQAIYLPSLRQVECLICAEPVGVPEKQAVAADPPIVDAGIAGASARRKYEHLAAKREERIRAAHPRLGGLILAVSDEPQSTRAWERGAVGEELLAKWLNPLIDHGVRVLHDRRIPGSRANIDHIAISTAGVFVIDAKRYAGRPRLRIEGGFLRPRTETLLVGTRDCTKLIHGVLRQVEDVRSALPAELSQVAIHGMLCFVEADWPLIGGSFRTGGIEVLWPAKAQDKIVAAGPLTDDQVATLHHTLARKFPSA